MTTGNADYIGMVSADGAWRWDGGHWVPNNPPPADRRMPGQFLPTPAIVTACVLLVVFAFVVVAMVVSSNSDAEAEQNFNDVYCQRWAEPGDPSC